VKGYILTIFETIPTELTVREHPITVLVGLGMFLSFVLISLAKLLQSDVYTVLLKSFFKGKQLFLYLKESFPVFKGSSLLLFVNYLLSFSILLYFVLSLPQFEMSHELFIVTLTPIVFLFFGIGSLLVGMLLTGEREVFATPILMKINGAQLLGLYSSILVFLWALGFMNKLLFVELCIWGIFTENILRIIRSFLFVLTAGVSWYYIIIYLCTLEILPLLVLYYYLAIDFSF
jgi:hypothetical protein